MASQNIEENNSAKDLQGRIGHSFFDAWEERLSIIPLKVPRIFNYWIINSMYSTLWQLAAGAWADYWIFHIISAIGWCGEKFSVILFLTGYPNQIRRKDFGVGMLRPDIFYPETANMVFKSLHGMNEPVI